MTILDLQGESGGVGKAKDFRQSLPPGVQPKRGLMVTRFLSGKTHTIINLQRVQMQPDSFDGPFDAFFKEGSDFQSERKSSENVIPIMKGTARTQKASFSPFVYRYSLLFRRGFQTEYS